MKPSHNSNYRFETLDALRFFAFFRVFLLHIPNSINSHFFEAIKNGGEIGVAFFFVLSGFLITYLLAKEKASTGKLDAKKFMMRRILRIWPLYYLGVLMAYANIAVTQHYGIGSSEGYMPNPLFSLSFTENIKMLLEDNFPNGAPLRAFWTLCVEEQFYILWVIIFKIFPFKHISKVLAVLLLLAWSYRIAVPYFLHNTHFTDVDLISNLDYFCMGGFLALIMAGYPGLIKKLSDWFVPALQLPVIMVGVLFFFCHQYISSPILHNPIYFPTIAAFIFTMLIACYVLPSAHYRIPNRSLLGQWGKISYGLYVYHTPVILVLLLAFKAVHFQSGHLGLIIFTVLALSATIIISNLSYRWFEKPFLALRIKYFSK
jgi:peptidoglycan/LPS O-acetylase OafA/YrhL